MGYKRSALLLEWPEDSEFSGLEIRMRRLTIGQLTEVERLADLSRDKSRSTGAALADLLDAIGDGLLGWNFEDDGGAPIPATREALDGCDIGMILALVRVWVSVIDVPLVSPPSSPTGAPADPPDEWATYLATNQETSPAPVS